MPQESKKAQSKETSSKPKGKPKKKSKGLGDSIEKAIPKPVKKIVEAIAGEDCGCEKRKEWLNKRFPYFNPFSEADKLLWTETLEPALRKNKLVGNEQELVIDLYERTFRKRHKKTRCGSCVEARMIELEKAYEASCTDS
tara:strand:+ start:598 stop:1017 length:420 start_codon:yes stop_codon:yes gene_type:complete